MNPYMRVFWPRDSPRTELRVTNEEWKLQDNVNPLNWILQDSPGLLTMIHQLDMAITTDGSNHNGIWIQSKHLMQIQLENGPTLAPKINTQPAKLQPSLIMPKHSGYGWKFNLLMEGEGRAGQDWVSSRENQIQAREYWWKHVKQFWA